MTAVTRLGPCDTNADRQSRQLTRHPSPQEDFPSLTLPETNFTCESKVSGGHYADPETDCKMFHICVMGPDKT